MPRHRPSVGASLAGEGAAGSRICSESVRNVIEVGRDEPGLVVQRRRARLVTGQTAAATTDASGRDCPWATAPKVSLLRMCTKSCRGEQVLG
jgi:hypothetical protein